MLLPKTYTARWNAYRDASDTEPQESHEEEFEVAESAFEDPFLPVQGVTQWARAFRKYTAYNVNTFVQTLEHEPEAGDVLILQVWNSNGTTTVVGDGTQGWVQRARGNSPNVAVFTEVWTKRWGDVGQTDSLEWELTNSSGLILGWTVVVRGCPASGSYFDAAAVTSANNSTALPVTAPTVTSAGVDRLVVRLFSCTHGGLHKPRHSDPSDGRFSAQSYVWIDGEPGFISASVFSASTSIKGAGATGTATIDTIDLGASYLWHAATVALVLE